MSQEEQMQSKQKIANSAFPTELGPLDLKAAQAFKKDWEKRNQTAAKSKKKS